MATIEYKQPATGRPLLRVAAPDVGSLPAAIGCQPGRYVLFVGADTRTEPEAALVQVAKELLRAGAVAVHCWGPGAGRLETAFDLAAAAVFPETDPVVMTSSDERHPLEHAIWDAVMATYPDDALEDGWQRVVLALVNSAEWTQQADAYLAAGVPLPDEA
jgi:hypothetical protein